MIHLISFLFGDKPWRDVPRAEELGRAALVAVMQLTSFSAYCLQNE